MQASRDDILRYRVHAQQLDRDTDDAFDDTDILDLGAQDTGNEGSAWALALRGVRFDPRRHIIAWTLRGAPTAYRRAQAAEVAHATAAYDEADAAKRVLNASRPLKTAGIPVREALAVVADNLREIVTEPTVKGVVSTRLTQMLPDPYLRYCPACAATHSYEMPFRLSALAAGLELAPDTSPPVLTPIPGWTGAATDAPARLDPVRACLHLFGPLTPRHVAEYIEAPVKTVLQHWPADVEQVEIAGAGGEHRSMLSADVAPLNGAPESRAVRLLGSHDLFLQSRDHSLIVPDESRHRHIWPTIGRPGAVLCGHEVVGTWRPRSSGSKLSLAFETWADVPRRQLEDQAVRLTEHRGQVFTGFA
jgi:hypothetical protein